MNAHTTRADHIDKDVQEVQTRDQDRLDVTNAATAIVTESPAIAPEALNPDTESAIAVAVEIDAQDLLTITNHKCQQQEADDHLLAKIETHHPKTQTQMTL